MLHLNYFATALLETTLALIRCNGTRTIVYCLLFAKAWGGWDRVGVGVGSVFVAV